MKHRLQLDFEDSTDTAVQLKAKITAMLVFRGCKHITVTNLPVEQAGDTQKETQTNETNKETP